jgi:hypothetical protein
MHARIHADICVCLHTHTHTRTPTHARSAKNKSLCDLFATIFVTLEETQNLARVQHHQAFIVASKALILQAGLVLRAITSSGEAKLISLQEASKQLVL